MCIKWVCVKQSDQCLSNNEPSIEVVAAFTVGMFATPKQTQFIKIRLILKYKGNLLSKIFPLPNSLYDSKLDT